MKERCKYCEGSGKKSDLDVCPTCKGYGVKTFTLDAKTQFTKGKVKGQGQSCKTCEGTGKIRVTAECDCDNGWRYLCELCKNTTDSNNLLCRKCFQDPIIYELRYPFDRSILEKRAVIGDVVNIQGSTAIISVADVQGSLKLAQIPKGTFIKGGDRIPVSLSTSSIGKNYNEFVYVRVNNYKIQSIRSKNIPLSPSFERIINNEVNEGFIIRAKAEISSIKQTSGPTLFKLIDEYGNTVVGVGFIEAGQRAFPQIQEGFIVEVAGHYNIHQGQTQIDLREMIILPEDVSEEFRSKVSERLQEKTKAPEIPFSINSELLEKLKPQFQAITERIRQAIFTGQNIVIKYYHPSVDATCASIVLELAILDLMRAKSIDSKASLRKYPERMNYYEFGDASRDVVSFLEEQVRAGGSSELPLLILVDIGSSEENSLTFDLLSTYDIDTIVLDNHVIGENIPDKIKYFINPFLFSDIDDYQISVGMLTFELARMISSDSESFTGRLKHSPAISGLSEKVSSPNENDSEIAQYLALAKDSFSLEKLEEFMLAIDYQTFFLRTYSDGGILLSELLGLGDSPKVVENLVPKLANQAKLASESAIKPTLIHAETSNLNATDGGSEIVVTKIDFELTPRTSYPTPSKTTEIIHEQLYKDHEGKIVVTLGIGHDYILVHSSGVKLDLKSILENIKLKLPSAGVIQGSGHGRIGFVRFFAPFKKDVLEHMLSEFALISS
jgi:RecJ-like exonuclease